MMFDHPHDDPILILDDEQCWRLLENTQHGRLVLVVDGEPDIFPVNFAVQHGDDGGRSLIFRTAPGTKLAKATVNDRVLFETDGILSDEAWSVIVRGTAQQLEGSAEIAEAEALELQPWVPTVKDHYVRIEPAEVSGRHFRFGPHPERELGEGSEAGL